MNGQLHTQLKMPGMLPGTLVPSLQLQRKCACGQHTIAGGECEECRQKREGVLQRSAISAAPTNGVPPVVHDVLNSPGQPLDVGTRAFMEPRFGFDFSRVRVHTDARAAESAQAVNALAYAVGSDVVFDQGQYNPLSSEGRWLLAHELTHVVQQNTGHGGHIPQALALGRVDDRAEQEAKTVADMALVGKAVGPVSGDSSSRPGIIRRFETSERNRITNLDAVVETARQIAEDRGLLGMMRWGRFTAGTGGFGAIEAIKDSIGSRARGLRNRYLFTCRCGLLDMRHFYQLSYIALLPFEGGNEGATEKGREHELTSEDTSRFAPEDMPSNALGAYFGSQQSTFERQSTFIDNLRTYLQQCSPVDFATLSPADQDTIVNYYGSRGAGGRPSNPNETATPAVLGVTACGGTDRTFPFVVDPTDPHHETITGVAPVKAP